VTSAEGDCDDQDALTYPGADELWGDGVDQDCDGVADVAGASCSAQLTLDFPDGSSVTLDGCQDWYYTPVLEFDPDEPPEVREFTLHLGATDNSAFGLCQVEIVQTQVCGTGYYDAALATQTTTFSLQGCSGIGDDFEADYTAASGFMQLTTVNGGAIGGILPGAAVALALEGDLQVDDGAGVSLVGTFSISGEQWVSLSASGTPCSVTDGDEDLDGQIDTYFGGTDCDDGDASVGEGTEEVCDGKDNDCSGSADFDGALELDDDADGSWSCDDCDDSDGINYPGNTELCDGLDNDCNDLADADGALESDSDEDGSLSCDDCDDADADNFPGNTEVCDGLDNDCDTLVAATEDLSLAPVLSNAYLGENRLRGNLFSVTASGWLDSFEMRLNAPQDSILTWLLYRGADTAAVLDQVASVTTTSPSTGAQWHSSGPIPHQLEAGYAYLLAVHWNAQVTYYADPLSGPEALSIGELSAGAAVGTTDSPQTLAPASVSGATASLASSPSPEAFAMIVHLSGEEDPDGDTWPNCDDCDDNEASIYTGAPEISCDTIDQDCDGLDTTDLDGDLQDGLGCGGDDCDDSDPNNFLGNTEVCDGQDNDCDTAIDEDNVDSSGYCSSCECTTWWRLSDTAEDGWSGGYVELNIEGSFYGIATMSSPTATGNIYGCIPHGSQFSWQYSPGSDSAENSYFVETQDDEYYYGSTYHPDADPSGYPPDTEVHTAYALCGSPCPEEDALEPNSSSSAPFALSPGTYTDLTICPADSDWYELSLTEGDWLRVDLEFAHAEANTRLQLYSGSNLLNVAYSYSDDQSLVYDVPSSGTYQLVVYQHADLDSVRGGSYDMTVATGSTPCGAGELSLILADNEYRGWDGASLQVSDGAGGDLGSYALEFGEYRRAYCIPDTGCTELAYTAGTDDSAHWYSLLDATGASVYYSGLQPNPNFSYEHPSGCSD